jgi:hypothetical protein
LLKRAPSKTLKYIKCSLTIRFGLSKKKKKRNKSKSGFNFGVHKKEKRNYTKKDAWKATKTKSKWYRDPNKKEFVPKSKETQPECELFFETYSEDLDY